MAAVPYNAMRDGVGAGSGAPSSDSADDAGPRGATIGGTVIRESGRAGDLLRELSVSDEAALRRVLAPGSVQGTERTRCTPALDRRTRLLVQLAALLVSGASAQSLRWAVELAGTSGADDEAIAAVLVATGPAAGSAQLVACAPRLALAMGLEPGDVAVGD